MSKLAILKIGDGDFDSGFAVTLRIESDSVCIAEIDGRLSPAPMISKQYDDWKSTYSAIGLEFMRVLQPITGQTTNISIIKLAQELKTSLNQWLNELGREFQPIRDGLLYHLKSTEDIRFIIKTSDQILLRLPWHLCDLFERYPNAEVTISPPNQAIPNLPNKLKEQVRILVILGMNSEIDVQADLEILKDKLPDAYLFPLIATSRDKLDNELWSQKWDIMFFAGHSCSDLLNGQGKFFLNETESITIEQLKYGLQNAIANGLKLAIFNSCDGLGLAQDLADLQMPAIIVMRERIQDVAAQRFLEFFLEAFATKEKALCAAVREARERLYGLENRYPCASWLPVLCQHQNAEELTWMGLRDTKKTKRPKSSSILQGLQTVVLASILITSTLIGARSLGILQQSELKAYDHLTRLRPFDEGPDSRLLLITINENDVQSQSSTERGGASISNSTLDRVRERLEPYQPRAIGLLIYREAPVSEDYPSLANWMQQSDRLIAICTYGESGVPAPPEIPPERQSFNDVLRDPDGIIRRNLLAVGSPSPCENYYSFGFHLAKRYLADEGIELAVSPDDYLQLGNIVFKPLQKNTGGYRELESQGHQIMLNYRAASEIAPRITLTQVLNGQFNTDLIKNRIVLIGTTAPSFNNHRWLTPYSSGQWPIKEFTGIEVQAQMTSQILSAVLDNRPLIWWWSDFGENIWIYCWSLLGGILTWYFQSLPRLLLVGGVALIVLYGSCLYLLTEGGWVPLVPSALALVATGGSVVAYIQFQRKSLQKVII